MPDDNKSKPDDKDSKNKIFEIMKDLQPVAFFISICLVIAAFYLNNHNMVDGIYFKNILMASLFFLFAYIGLLFFKVTNFPLFSLFGDSSLFFGAFYLFMSFAGIVQIISNATSHSTNLNNVILGNATTGNTVTGNLTIGNGQIYSDPNSLLIFIFLVLFPLLLIMYFSGKEKGNLYYKCKIFFHLSFILYVSCILLSIFGILSWIKTTFLSIVIGINVLLLWFSIAASLFPLAYSFGKKISFLNDLSAKLKNEKIYSPIPTESLKVIVISLIIFGILVSCIGIILGNFRLLVDNLIISLGVITLFFICLICVSNYKQN